MNSSSVLREDIFWIAFSMRSENCLLQINPTAILLMRIKWLILKFYYGQELQFILE